jgi:hypothetical protein
VAAPRRSTTVTTEAATMVVARVPATSTSAAERRHRGRSGAGAWAGTCGRAWGGRAGRVLGRAGGDGSPTQTPNGGGRSGTPPAGDHNRDMTLPRPAKLPRLPGLSPGG